MKVELPERREDRVPLVDAFGANDTRGEGFADGGGRIVEAKSLVPDGVEMGAGVEENIHVDRTGRGAGGVNFGTEGREKGWIVQQVREYPEGDFVSVVVDSGGSQQGHPVWKRCSKGKLTPR